MSRGAVPASSHPWSGIPFWKNTSARIIWMLNMITRRKDGAYGSLDKTKHGLPGAHCTTSSRLIHSSPSCECLGQTEILDFFQILPAGNSPRGSLFYLFRWDRVDPSGVSRGNRTDCMKEGRVREVFVCRGKADSVE